MVIRVGKKPQYPCGYTHVITYYIPEYFHDYCESSPTHMGM